MKKVIDGKRYNTETAEKIAEWRNGLSITDFRFAEEELYRTKTGRFFIYGNGGAMSRWSRPEGDGHGPGQDIVPLSKDEATKWCEEHDMTDTLEEYFPEYIEDA